MRRTIRLLHLHARKSGFKKNVGTHASGMDSETMFQVSTQGGKKLIFLLAIDLEI